MDCGHCSLKMAVQLALQNLSSKLDSKVGRKGPKIASEKMCQSEHPLTNHYKMRDFLLPKFGFDYGVGHSLLLLADAKASHVHKSEEFNGLGHYPANISIRSLKTITKSIIHTAI